ncbi:MAG TPA: pantoate--beta-alanine ligase [Sphingomicrobium sp.]|nr:pantoate--beta-alanine ligase [Sphingomicrobium sp.]
MQIIRESFALDLALSHFVGDGEQIAFVPTMGALHEGHLTLVARAKELAERVVVSIFVNPLQFNDPTDLERYPRQEESDLAKLEAAGCDLVWLPSASDLYPEGFATTVSVAGVSERWEGEHRPGHFDGVATVVAKLLKEVVPNVALFGEKDFQQLAVIRRMATDLGLCENIVGVPTVRDPDGLAMSSRNVHLSTDERERALSLPATLNEAARQILDGEPVDSVLDKAKQVLADAGFSKIDYFALVDAATLEPLDKPSGEMRLIAAATIGTTRLIDNIRVVSATV